MSLKIFVLLSLNVLTVESAKILGVFPVPSVSHQVVFRKLCQELAKRGHELTVITPDPAYPEGGAPTNYKEINVREESYGTLLKRYRDEYKTDKDVDAFAEFRRILILLAHLIEAQVQAPEVKELLAKDKYTFDLIFIEALLYPALAFSHVFKAPVILVSSMGSFHLNNEMFGIPSHPSIYPSSMEKYVNNQSFWTKLDNFYSYFAFKYAHYLNVFDDDRMIQKNFGPETPPLNELYNNVDMLFLNINSIWANNQPVPPNVIYMGGIHQNPENDLPKDLETYLNDSENGVIYLSFGTNVFPHMISSDKIDIMVKVLSNLPYDVLWKWNDDELPGKGDNIKISKWYPQSDLLRHPNIKLFITQAGLQSTDEAITSGVPLVAIPMLGDQWYNAEQYVKHGIGKKLDIKTLSENDFRSAIETVIKDKSYRSNIKDLGRLIRDQPETPLQRAVWWTEYVIRNKGAKQLRSPGANITIAEYFELRLLFLVLSVVSISLLVIATAISFLLKSISKFFISKNKSKAA